MYSAFSWEKEYFKNTYYIYDQGVQIGFISETSFCRNARARLRKIDLNYKTCGIFKHRTTITNRSGQIIGHITFNYFNSTATLTLNEKSVVLKNYNFWNSKLELTDHRGTSIKMNGSSLTGTIESQNGDETLMLSGLYVANLFMQTHIGIWLALLIPLWVSLFVLL